MTLEEKLKKAQALGKKPIELSEPEEHVLKDMISLLKEGLDQVLEEALKMPRDEAFKKINSYVHALSSAAPLEEAIEIEDKIEKPKPPSKPVAHPKLEALLNELPEDKQSRARTVLSCIKAYNRLEEEGEDGNQALCHDCTPEKMLACIKVEDPRVIDELDQELRKAGVVRA